MVRVVGGDLLSHVVKIPFHSISFSHPFFNIFFFNHALIFYPHLSEPNSLKPEISQRAIHVNLTKVIKRINNRIICSLKSGAQHYVSLLTNLCQQNKKVAHHCTVFQYILTTTDDHFISVWMQNAKTYTQCGIFLCKHTFFFI